MSFGYAISDVVALGGLAYKVVQNSRKACGEHDELTREVSAFYVVLQSLETEVAKASSPLNQSDSTGYGQELTGLVEDSRKVLRALDSILMQYNALSESERSAKKLWKKIRFGNGEMADIGDYRAKLVFFTSAISFHLNLATMGTVGRVERQMTDAGGLLTEMKTAVDSITAYFISESKHEGSVLISYADDDKAVWREFRRELVQEGFLSADVKKHKRLIKAYIQELGKRGLFDEEVTEPQEALAEEQNEDRIKRREESVANDGARDRSTSGEQVDRKTVRSTSTAKTPAVEPSTAASSLDETIPVRTPKHAYVETDLDPASDCNASADNHSAISPSLSGSADTPCIVPIATPDIELRGEVVHLKQTERHDEHVDIVDSEAGSRPTSRKIELSEANLKKLSWGDSTSLERDMIATIDSDSIKEREAPKAWCFMCFSYLRRREGVKLLCGHFHCLSCFTSRLTDGIFTLSEWKDKICICGSKIIQHQASSLQNLPLLTALDRSLWGTNMDRRQFADRPHPLACNDPTCMASNEVTLWAPWLDAVDSFIAEWAPLPASQCWTCRRCSSQICALCKSKWRNYHCCAGQWQMLNDLRRKGFWNSQAAERLKLPGQAESESDTEEDSLSLASLSTSEDSFSTNNAEPDEEAPNRWESRQAKRKPEYMRRTRPYLRPVRLPQITSKVYYDDFV